MWRSIKCLRIDTHVSWHLGLLRFVSVSDLSGPDSCTRVRPPFDGGVGSLDLWLSFLERFFVEVRLLRAILCPNTQSLLWETGGHDMGRKEEFENWRGFTVLVCKVPLPIVNTFFFYGLLTPYLKNRLSITKSRPDTLSNRYIVSRCINESRHFSSKFFDR